MSKRILFVSHYPTHAGIDGANRVLITTAVGIGPENYERLVLSPGHGVMSEYLSKAGIEEKILEYDHFRFETAVMYEAKNKNNPDEICRQLEYNARNTKLYQFFKEWKPDIVYVNSMVAGYAAVIGKMINSKVIWHIHEIHQDTVSEVDRRNLNHIIASYADKIIVISKAVRKSLGKSGQLDKCELIYNGVEDPGYSSQEITKKQKIIKEHIGLKEDNPLVSFLGRIESTKGVDKFIMAADLVLKKEPKARFVITGDTDRNPGYTRKLKELISRLGREKEIKFGGYCHDLSMAIPAIDCMVVPSVYREPFGLVSVEANLYRKPVVAFDQGGIGEVVIHRKNGFLIEKDNIKHMAAAIYAIITKPKMVKKMGEFGYKRAVNRFGLSRYIDNIKQIIDEVGEGQYKALPCRNGNVVMGEGPKVYYIEGGLRRYIQDEATFEAMGLVPNDIQKISEEDLSKIPLGEPIYM